MKRKASKKIQSYFFQTKQLVLILFVFILVACLGVYLIKSGHAATFATSSETESGTTSGNSSVVSDSNASGGSAVKFGASSAGTACNLPGNGNCGPYTYSQITNSNGFNTYVSNQLWGCGTPGSCGPSTMTAYNPGNWSVNSTQAAGNTAVLMFPDVQQLTNNWGNGGFNGSSDMPISGVGAITSTYAENMHENSGTFAEAAYDIWTSSGEVMIWVDTTANRGSGGAVQEGAGTIGGIPMTYYVYGGTLPFIKLNTNQQSGTINILDGLHYLQSKGVVASNATINQINFGWEICSTGGLPETFNVSSYSLTMTPN